LSADYQDRPATDYEATTSVPIVSDAARAQLAAIRDEFVQPLVGQIAAQAEQIGRLSAERDQLWAKLDELRAEAATEDAPVAPQAAQDEPAAAATTQDPARGFWSRLRAIFRGP